MATQIAMVAAGGFMLPLTTGKRSGLEAAEHTFAALLFLTIAFACSL